MRLSLILLSAFFICTQPSLWALPQNYVGEVTGTSVNVRKGAHTSYEVITQLKKGQNVFVMGEKNNWLKIQLPESTSLWIYKTMVHYEEGEGKSSVQKDKVNIRLYPQTEAPILLRAPKGMALTVIGEKGNWYKIKSPRKAAGWVDKNYISFHENIHSYLKEQQRQAALIQLNHIKDLHREEMQKVQNERNYDLLIKSYQTLLPSLKTSDLYEKVVQVVRQLKGLKEDQDYKKITDSIATAKKEGPLSLTRLNIIKSSIDHFVETYPDSQRILALKETLSELEPRSIMDVAQNQQDDNTEEQDLVKLAQQEFTGVIFDMGVVIDRPATHKLLVNNKVVCLLRSGKFDLNRYIYRNVTVSGWLYRREGWDVPILTVNRLEPVNQKG